jgi:hypothetical protein
VNCGMLLLLAGLLQFADALLIHEHLNATLPPPSPAVVGGSRQSTAADSGALAEGRLKHWFTPPPPPLTGADVSPWTLFATPALAQRTAAAAAQLQECVDDG